MVSRQITIEDWDGDGGIRIPDEVLQEMGVDVGDSLYLIEEFVGTTRALLLSKTPRISSSSSRSRVISEASIPPNLARHL
jgi:antitoxin component of MazEF toxin-antitoxin module